MNQLIIRVGLLPPLASSLLHHFLLLLQLWLPFSYVSYSYLKPVAFLLFLRLPKMFVLEIFIKQCFELY